MTMMTATSSRIPEALAELARELPLVMTKDQAIQVMHISERTFARIVSRGELKVIKTAAGRSGRVSVTRSEVIRWMAERVT